MFYFSEKSLEPITNFMLAPLVKIVTSNPFIHSLEPGWIVDKLDNLKLSSLRISNLRAEVGSMDRWTQNLDIKFILASNWVN